MNHGNVRGGPFTTGMTSSTGPYYSTPIHSPLDSPRPTLSRQVPTSLEEYDDAILTAFGDALGPSVVERYPLTQFSNNAAAAYVQARSDAQVCAQLPQCAPRVSRPRACRRCMSPTCVRPCHRERARRLTPP